MKGLNYEEMKGTTGVEFALDAENNVGHIRFPLNGERVESSTKKTFIAATGYTSFQLNDKRHSLRLNFLENKTKADYQSAIAGQNDTIAEQAKLIAKLQGQAVTPA